MSRDYDVIVVGGGPAGEHCAGQLATGGLRVAIVERELLGGECSFWACIPSKTLVRPGEALQAAREAPGAREAGDGGVHAAEALAWRDFMVSDYSDAGQLAWAQAEGIDVIRGSGRLDGPGRVAVDEDVYTSRDVVIATASYPFVPPVPGLRELPGVWDNRAATGLREILRRLVVLGAGPVGLELGQAVARMGGSVAIVEAMEHVLPREPRPLGEALGEALAEEGIELCFGQLATAARFEDNDYVLEFPEREQLRGDKLLVAAGRRPRVENIGLETVGIEPAKHGIEVNARMRASDGVWAIGDMAGIWPLTYVAKYQGRVAAANILGGDREANYDAVPRVVFTDPQAATVGETDGRLTATVPLSEVPRTATYTRDYEQSGFMTLISDGERLTGAYALGPEAGEWLQQATVAIRARVPLEVMNDVIQPFPTFSEAFLHTLQQLSAKAPAAA